MRFALAFTLALPLFSPATAIPQVGGSCNTGRPFCCNSVQRADNASLASLGITPGSATGFVGVNCSPISVIGLGGNACSAQPVCCTGKTVSGIITLGCTPIDVNS